MTPYLIVIAFIAAVWFFTWCLLRASNEKGMPRPDGEIPGKYHKGDG